MYAETKLSLFSTRHKSQLSSSWRVLSNSVTRSELVSWIFRWVEKSLYSIWFQIELKLYGTKTEYYWFKYMSSVCQTCLSHSLYERCVFLLTLFYVWLCVYLGWPAVYIMLFVVLFNLECLQAFNSKSACLGEFYQWFLCFSNKWYFNNKWNFTCSGIYRIAYTSLKWKNYWTKEIKFLKKGIK